MILPYCLNTVWMLSCQPERMALTRAKHRVEEAQTAVLRGILRKNRESQYGRKHAFETIGSVKEFQERVPPTTYELLQDSLEKIALGDRHVLTSEPVLLLEPTSGSTGGEKLIPYTRSLQQEFQRAISAWIGDLLWHRPTLRQGRAYWSVSPALGPARRSPGGLPIGFDDDTAYLGGPQQRILQRLLVVPGQIAKVAVQDDFRYATLLHLLAAADLTLISIWSPTFLTSLLETLPQWADQIVSDLRQGHLTWHSRDAGPRPIIPIKADPRRADELDAIFRSTEKPAERYAAIWPQLSLLSCWADAAAEFYVPGLRALFPQLEIQPKGLISTEAFVSLPLCKAGDPALALRSHFLEFEEAKGDELAPARPLKLAHELELGATYRVLVTTGGGLYRYRLGDLVEVVGFAAQCPLVRFRGRTGGVSDLVGEKLSELFVRAVLGNVTRSLDWSPSFLLLTPAPGKPRYRLYLQGPGICSWLGLPDFEQQFHGELLKNPYYRLAIELGQLYPVEIRLIDEGGMSGWSIYQEYCRQRGQKLGQIKPAVLDARPDCATHFDRELDLPTNVSHSTPAYNPTMKR